jgi:signal transduction histidine kinase
LIFLVCNIGILVPTVYGSKKLADLAVSVNLGGRQRMLSQRTAKALLSLRNSGQHSAAGAADLKELASVVTLFDTTLKGFLNGGVVTGGDGHPVHLVPVETSAGRQVIRDAYEVWNPYLVKLKPLLASADFSPAELDAAVTYAQANNLKILGLMNDLTTDLEHSANRMTQWLWWIQIVGLIVVLLNVLYTVLKSIAGLVQGDRALAHARNETDEILGTVKEGLFLIGPDYRLGSQYSKSVNEVLQRKIAPQTPFFPILEQMLSKDVYENAKDYIQLLLGNRVKESLVTSLNPLNAVQVRAMNDNAKPRYLTFNFNRVLDEKGKISHLLVTVQDVTELVQLNAQLESAQSQARVEVEALLNLLSNDSGILNQFLDNVKKALAEINQRLQSKAENGSAHVRLINDIMRIMHGIKGEAAALNIETLENYAHAFEKELMGMREHGIISGEDTVRIAVLLEGFYERLAVITTIAGRMTIGRADGKDVNDGFLQSLNQSLQNLVTRIAGDEQKEAKVVCQLESLALLPRPVVNELHGITIQLLRNAVKHGIETPAERKAEGKSSAGEIHVECQTIGHNEYELKVRDDGRGIDVSKVQEELVRRNMFSAAEAAALSRREVMSHLFDPGFSTAKEADRDAGHGVGLNVVAQKITALRGRLILNSQIHAFTEFRMRFSL